MDSPGWSSLLLAQAVSQSTLFTQSFVLLLVLGICAFASAAETALTSVNRIHIKNLAEKGDKRAQQIELLLAKPNVFLTTILVINNVAIIVASSIATVIAIALLPEWGQVLSTIIISIVALVFCEVTPKNAAVQNADSWALAMVPTVAAASWLLQPITTAFNNLTGALLRLAGIPLTRTGPSVTEEELRLLVNVGEEEGTIEEDESNMIHSIFTLSDTTVREVMVPRIDMVTLEVGATLTEAVDLITQGGQSRIPMYEETIDNIIGVLYAKDLLRELRNRNQDAPLHDLVRPAYFVPESKKLDDLLHELQHKRVHMAIVFDESGAISGLVTIEDLVEEIIGDIQDEYDREESVYDQISPTEYIFDAKINIEDFNEVLETSIEPDEDYDSLAGYVLATLDKIPSVGDVVEADGVTLTVLATRGRRITKIKAVLKEPLDMNDAVLDEKNSTATSNGERPARKSGPVLHH